MSVRKLLKNSGWAALAAAVVATGMPAQAWAQSRAGRDAPVDYRPMQREMVAQQRAARQNAQAQSRSQQRAQPRVQRSERREAQRTPQRVQRTERRDVQRAQQIDRRNERRAARTDASTREALRQRNVQADRRNNTYVAPERNRTYRDNDRDRQWRDNDRSRQWRDNDRNRQWRDNDRNRQWRDNDRRGDNRWRNDNRRDDRRWDRRWRDNDRYSWQRYRNSNRVVFRVGPYYSPYRNYNYRRFNIGVVLNAPFYSQSYWINDPWQYRLPPAYGSYRWVRYYNDVLLVDIYSGEVVDVIHDFFY